MPSFTLGIGNILRLVVMGDNRISMEQWPEEFDDYESDDLSDECDHEDYEVDILTGRAECNRCPHSWYQTAEDIEREIERIREYDAWQAEQYRAEHWWWRVWFWLRDTARAALAALDAMGAERA